MILDIQSHYNAAEYQIVFTKVVQMLNTNFIFRKQKWNNISNKKITWKKLQWEQYHKLPIKSNRWQIRWNNNGRISQSCYSNSDATYRKQAKKIEEFNEKIMYDFLYI